MKQKNAKKTEGGHTVPQAAGHRSPSGREDSSKKSSKGGSDYGEAKQSDIPAHYFVEAD